MMQRERIYSFVVILIFWASRKQRLKKKKKNPFLANTETLGDRFINCWKEFCIRVTQFTEASFLTFNELQKGDI